MTTDSANDPDRNGQAAVPRISADPTLADEPSLNAQSASSAHPPRELLDVGSMLGGRYRIVAKSGGGMGTVYFADDLDNGLFGKALRVAIKTVPEFDQWRLARSSAGLSADQNTYANHVTRFRREALTWIRLGLHPHVIWAVWVLDLGGKPYLVMEYADGGDLRARLETGRLPLATALNFALQFCDGMRYLARTISIVHRDIKPANVLLKNGDILKIADFGLAKGFDPEVEQVAQRSSLSPDGLTSGLGGSPSYRAPEQAKGLRYADTRSDIFSFGAMLFEMLTGRRLLRRSAGEPFEPFARPLPTLQDVDPALPDALSAIVSRCVELDPERRYASFDELLLALTRVCETIGGVPPLPTDVAHVRRTAVNTPSLDLLGETYTLISLGKHAEAVTCAAKAIALDPKNADHWINKSKAHADLGDFQSARTCALEATRLAPMDVHGWANLGWANLMLGDPAAGLEAARRAIAVDAGWGDAWMCRGACERDLGMTTQAITSLRKAVEVEPHNWKAHANLGLQLKDLDRFSEAFDALTQATRMNPQDTACWNHLAWIHARVRSWAEAREAIDWALKYDPADANAWAMRAWVMWANGGDASEIQEALRRSDALDPGNRHASTIRHAITASPGVRPRHAFSRAAPPRAPHENPSPANLTIIAGTRARLSAIEQNVVAADANFGAVLLLPTDPANNKIVVEISAIVTCHDCGNPVALEYRVTIGSGLESALLSCDCGSQINLMVSGSAHNGSFLVVSPFTSRTDAEAGNPDITILDVIQSR